MTAPFVRYPARPDAVSSAGETLAASGASMLETSQAAVRAAAPAVDNVWGFLTQLVANVTDPVAVLGAALRDAAGFAGSAVTGWAAAIFAYDTIIDGLNADYASAAASGFGVSAPAMNGVQTTEERNLALDGHTEAVQSARTALLAWLEVRKQAADDDLDAAAMDLAAMLGRGPNQGDWNSLGSAGVIPSAFYGSVEGGEPGEPGGPGFVIGPPTRPGIEWDEDFEYDSASAGFSDHLARLEWQAKLRGGQLLKPGLDDATAMYQHYWDNNGDPIEFDYEEGYNEDSGIRLAVDNEIARAQQGAEALIRAGNTSFSMTGDATGTTQGEYPETENWQKTIGGYQQWSSAQVSLDGTTVTMEVVVHAEDHYNFNRDQSDIATGASDDENGRFTELGWARPFDSSGAVTRTVTWEFGEAAPPQTTESGDPQRNPGREDREDERESGDPDRPVVPDNNRDTGEPRGN